MEYLFILSFFIFFQESDNAKLIGNWDLKHYDAIQKIKTSPRYQMGDAKVRAAMDKQFDEMVKNGGYSFTKDTLDYAELEGTQVRYRVGLWRMKDQILYITEIDRPFSRRVFIRHLSADSLVISPINEAGIEDSKMIFKRNKDSVSQN